MGEDETFELKDDRSFFAQMIILVCKVGPEQRHQGSRVGKYDWVVNIVPSSMVAADGTIFRGSSKST